MSAVDKSILKTYFNTGDKPTEAQFSELIDSALMSFCPDDYGAVGDGSTDDTVAVQDTIDAAAQHTAANIILRKAYNIKMVGIRDFQQYTNINYSLWINNDNLHIYGPGRLIITNAAKFGVGSVAFIAFGNGDAEIKNVGMHGVTIDASGLSAGDLLALSGSGTVGGTIGVHNVNGFHFTRNIVYTGFGINGAIDAITFTKNAYILYNEFRDSYKTSIRLDGIVDSHIIGNRVFDSGNVGIQLATNGDNLQPPTGNVVALNNIDRTIGFCIALTGGADNLIAGNKLRKGLSEACVYLVSGKVTPAEYDNKFNKVSGNQFYHIGGQGGIGLKLQGDDTSFFDGSPEYVRNNVISENTFIDLTTGVYLMESSINNKIINNYFDNCAADIGDDGSESITGNITTPNY